MKTFFEELIDRYRELRDARRRPGRRAGSRPPQPDTVPQAAVAPELPAEDLHIEALAREFPRELFAQLLIELPDYRKRMAESFAAGDHRRLRDSVHQILGAAAYCEADELEQGLRQLRLALKTGNSSTIEHYFDRAMQAMDHTLHNSGYRTHRE
ncbi:MAG: Hpt domain-containing protein [Gammaproteobacteria bacterium]